MPIVREILEGLDEARDFSLHDVNGRVEVKEDSFFEKFVSTRYGSIETPWKAAVMRRALTVAEESGIRGQQDFGSFRIELANFVHVNREYLARRSFRGEVFEEDIKKREQEIIDICNFLTIEDERRFFTKYEEVSLSLLNILRDAGLLQQNLTPELGGEAWDRIITLAARVTRHDIIDEAKRFAVVGSELLDKHQREAIRMGQQMEADGVDNEEIREATRSHVIRSNAKDIMDGKFGQGAVREFWLGISEAIRDGNNEEYDEYLKAHSGEEDVEIGAAKHVLRNIEDPDSRDLDVLYDSGIRKAVDYNINDRQETGVALGKSNDLVRSVAIAIQYKKAIEEWERERATAIAQGEEGRDFDIANYPYLIVRRSEADKGDKELIPGALVIDPHEELLQQDIEEGLSAAESLSLKVIDENRIIAQAVLLDRYKRVELGEWGEFDYFEFCDKFNGNEETREIATGLQEEIMMVIARDRESYPSGANMFRERFVPEDDNIDEYDHVAFSANSQFSNSSRTEDQRLLHHLATEASKNIAEYKAREKIAAAVIGRRERQGIIREKVLAPAATDIQRVWQGYLGRKKASEKREARDNKAATTIQAAFRGSVTRGRRIGEGEETLGEYLRNRALYLRRRRAYRDQNGTYDGFDVVPPHTPIDDLLPFGPSSSASISVPSGASGGPGGLSVPAGAPGASGGISTPAASTSIVAPSDASALAAASASAPPAPGSWRRFMTIDEYMSYVGPDSSKYVARLNGNGSDWPIGVPTATGFATYDGEKDGYKAFSQDIGNLSALKPSGEEPDPIKYLPALITNPAHNKAGVYAMAIQDKNGVTKVFGGSELLGLHDSEKHYQAVLDEGYTGDEARREAVNRAQQDVMDRIKEGQIAVDAARANPKEVRALLAGFPNKQHAAIEAMLSKNVASYGNNTTSIATRGNNHTLFFTENGDPHVYLPIPGSNGNAFLRVSTSRGGIVQRYKDGKIENVEIPDGEVYFDESTVWALDGEGKHVAIGIGNSPSIAGTTKAAKMTANALGVVATVFTLGLAGGVAKCLHQDTDSVAIKKLGIDASTLKQGMEAMRITATSHTRSLGIALKGKTKVKNLVDVQKHAHDENGDELEFRLDRMGLQTSSEKLYPLLDTINGIKVFAEISYGKDGPVVNPRLFTEFKNPLTGNMEKQEIKKSDLKTMVKVAENSSSEAEKQENLARVDAARAHLRRTFTVNIKQDIGDGKTRDRMIAIKAQLSIVKSPKVILGAIGENFLGNSEASTKGRGFLTSDKRGVKHDDILIDAGNIEVSPSGALMDRYVLAHKIESTKGGRPIELRLKLSHDQKNKASVDGENFYIESRDASGNLSYEAVDQAGLIGKMVQSGFEGEDARKAAKFAFKVLPDIKIRFTRMQGAVPISEEIQAGPSTAVGKIGREVFNLFNGREANKYSSIVVGGGRGGGAAAAA